MRKNTYRLENTPGLQHLSWFWGETNKQTPPPSHLMSRHLYSCIGVVCVVVLLYIGAVLLKRKYFETRRVRWVGEVFQIACVAWHCVGGE
jgi:hypothetical protein